MAEPAEKMSEKPKAPEGAFSLPPYRVEYWLYEHGKEPVKLENVRFRSAK